MPELYWIPLASILLAGVIRGIYSSARQIYGYSNPFLFGNPENDSHLGLLPITAVQAGIGMFVEMYVLLTFRPPLKDATLIPFIAFIIGVSGIVCLGHTFLRSLSALFMKHVGIVISSGVMSCVFGLFASQLPRYSFSVFEALLGGLLLGVLEIVLRKIVLQRFAEEESIHLFPLWLLTSLTGAFGFIGFVWAAFLSIPLVFIAVMVSHVVPFWIDVVGKITYKAVTPLCIVSRFRTLICEHCLRCSNPLSSQYTHGRRFCEHCRGEIEFTHGPGKVIVTFGNVSLDSIPGRIFILADTQHELWEQQQVDVSEIYINTQNCAPHLLERFITRLHHTPPKYGAGSVNVFYQGTLDALPANLHNALRNNFIKIALFSPPSPPFKSFENEHTYKTSLKAPAPLETQHRLPEILRHNVVLGGIIGVILGAASSMLVVPFSKMYFPEPFLAKFLRGAWIAASSITGGHRAKKYHLSPQRLGDWLIGIVILGVIAAIVIPNLLTAVSRSPQKRTMADLRAIGTAIGSYQVDYDQVPSTGNILWPLPELIEADGFVPSFYYAGSIYDGWGGPYYYISNGVSYTLVSFGKDKKPGSSEDFTEDIRFVNGALQDIVKGNFFD